MEKEQVDNEFVEIMLEIEKSYSSLTKHEKVRIEQWSRKLCQVTANLIWKKNRNKYAKFLLQLVRLGELQEPFTKLPPDGALAQFNYQLISRPQPRTPSLQSIRTTTPSKCLKPNTPQHFDSKLLFLGQNQNIPNKTLELTSINSSILSKKNSNEKYDTRSLIAQKANEELLRLQTQVEKSRMNEAHLMEELSKRNKVIVDMEIEIEKLRKENERMALVIGGIERRKENRHREIEERLKAEESVEGEDHELLSIGEISKNLKRLEKIQEALSKESNN